MRYAYDSTCDWCVKVKQFKTFKRCVAKEWQRSNKWWDHSQFLKKNMKPRWDMKAHMEAYDLAFDLWKSVSIYDIKKKKRTAKVYKWQ